MMMLMMKNGWMDGWMEECLGGWMGLTVMMDGWMDEGWLGVTAMMQSNANWVTQLLFCLRLVQGLEQNIWWQNEFKYNLKIIQSRSLPSSQKSKLFVAHSKVPLWQLVSKQARPRHKHLYLTEKAEQFSDLQSEGKTLKILSKLSNRKFRPAFQVEATQLHLIFAFPRNWTL